MTLADWSDEENRKAFEALKTLKIMTPFVGFSSRVPQGAGGRKARPTATDGSKP